MLWSAVGEVHLAPREAGTLGTVNADEKKNRGVSLLKLRTILLETEGWQNLKLFESDDPLCLFNPV